MKESGSPPRRLVWATDIHLDSAEPAARRAFLDEVRALEPDALLLGGDIAEAWSLEERLFDLAAGLRRPIFFVLGNHDFYHGSFREVEALAAELSRRSSLLRWLEAEGPVELAGGTCLLGCGGWGDGRCGEYARSRVELNDFRLIEELRGLDRAARRRAIERRGDEAAAWIRRRLPTALESHPRAILLTHVPPFAEAAWHEGRASEPDYLPFFACRAAGEALLETMSKRPDRKLLVLCGHTHGAGSIDPLPNLRVITGPAEYGRPRPQMVIDAAEIEG